MARAARAAGVVRRICFLGLITLGVAWVAPSESRRRSRVQARSWSAGPLGPVESADAFRIYYLPFVEPLDIDSTLLDQLLGGSLGPLTPLLLGLFVFWVQGQINAVRREQEGRAIGSAAAAIGGAAANTATSAAQSLTQKLASVPLQQWVKLLLCIALDVAGRACSMIFC